jgi:hypothetical protein
MIENRIAGPVTEYVWSSLKEMQQGADIEHCLRTTTSGGIR